MGYLTLISREGFLYAQKRPGSIRRMLTKPAVLSGNGMLIRQQAHIRDIESCIWLVDLLRELLPNAL